MKEPKGQPVVIRGVIIPFWELVALWIGVVLAGIPAMFILWIVGMVFGVVGFMVFGAIGAAL